MKPHATSPRAHGKLGNTLAKLERPFEYPHHATIASATMEVVHLSPDAFLRLENLGKRKRAKVSLPRLSILNK